MNFPILAIEIPRPLYFSRCSFITIHWNCKWLRVEAVAKTDHAMAKCESIYLCNPKLPGASVRQRRTICIEFECMAGRGEHNSWQPAFYFSFVCSVSISLFPPFTDSLALFLHTGTVCLFLCILCLCCFKILLRFASLSSPLKMAKTKFGS